MALMPFNAESQPSLSHYHRLWHRLVFLAAHSNPRGAPTVCKLDTDGARFPMPALLAGPLVRVATSASAAIGSATRPRSPRREPPAHAPSPAS